MEAYIFRLNSMMKCETGELVKEILRLPSMAWLFPIIVKGSMNRRTYTFHTPDDIDVPLLTRLIQHYGIYDGGYTNTLTFRLPQYGFHWQFSVKLIDSPTLTSMIIFTLPKKDVQNWEWVLGHFRAMLIELIPVLQVQAAVLYDTHPKRRKKPWLELTPSYRPQAYVGWMFYHNKEVVEAIGRERFEQLSIYSEKLEINGGYFISLQEEIMDWEQESHRLREEQAITELGLEDFLKQ